MTNEQAIAVLKCLIGYYNDEDQDSYVEFDDEDNEAIDMAIKALEQQPRMGEWIEVEVCNCYATLKCSVCDRVIEPTFTYGEYSYDDIKEWYPYCHCGCRMNGGGEDAEELTK